jgi:hypothetical protein
MGFAVPADAMSEEQTFRSEVNGSLPLSDIDRRWFKLKSKTYNGQGEAAKRTLKL